MKILLVDADSVNGYPNLSLMKLSAWMKVLGHRVTLIQGIPDTAPLFQNDYDEVYISTVFFQSRDKVVDYMNQFEIPVNVGGSGWNLENKLPESIEHMMPDYDLYGVDFSMGFTSRGCIRNCKFCIVPKKEGWICDHAPISQFLDPRHNRLLLLDNNFQASPKWRENIDYLIDNKIKVNFNQGLDARLVNDEFAEKLALVKCYNWKFTVRGAHLAFDNPRMKKSLIRALKIFDKAGMPPKRFVVYVLVGFDTTYEQDLDRIDTIVELGAVPYIMRFNKTKDVYLKDLSRYYNRKTYEWVQRDDYNNGVLKLG